MKAGKLDIDILKRLLERHTILDPRVVIGPKIGEDAAVIDLKSPSSEVIQRSLPGLKG
jgi:hypothetical protein